MLWAPIAEGKQTPGHTCLQLFLVLLAASVPLLLSFALSRLGTLQTVNMPQTITSTNGHSGRPKVLIPEKVSPDGLKLLQASLEVHERKGLSPDQLQEIIGDYDALIVRSETKVTAPLLAAGKKLRVVARAGVGVDNVDLEAATKLGVIVVNSPQGNINAAAEHTIALLMATARNVGSACASLKGGKWERSKLVGVEVKGKTLAIIGLGKGKSMLRYRSMNIANDFSSGSDSSSCRRRTRHGARCLRPICQPFPGSLRERRASFVNRRVVRSR